jgi:hypothetical protein
MDVGCEWRVESVERADQNTQCAAHHQRSDSDTISCTFFETFHIAITSSVTHSQCCSLDISDSNLHHGTERVTHAGVIGHSIIVYSYHSF